ncbi:PTS sugar transporter subunit IIB [Pectinatus haikarae]|uniref:Fructose-specific phosphotransferase system component IIB n=1 Tax=Pectinatus haikarae TaxID=349096 RepID=A0ABT9Y860_9FIRM|nr:hypothetical protein [Pectinatus haikarae]MDQ0204023.1 fructose-specific phosphotransferase system component IIB [Pectinatus haikarae]
MYSIVAVMANSQNELELYRAVNSLEKAAETKNIEIKVEIQEYPLTYGRLSKEDVSASTVAILTGDMPIADAERFADIPVFRTLTTAIASDPHSVIAAAMEKASLYAEPTAVF